MIRAASTLVLLFASTAASAPMSEGDRAFLASDAAGSLQSPMRLEAIAEVAKLCADVRAPRALEPDAEPSSKTQAALRKVYAARVPAGGFALADEGLALDLSRPLRALGGDLGLAVLDRDAGAFTASDEVVEGLRTQVRRGQVVVDVVFRLEGRDEDLPPCAGHAKSGAFTLRVEPLSFTLVDAAKGAELLRVRTPAWSALSAHLEPGAGAVRIEVRVAEGVVDVERIEAELERSALPGCFAPVLETPAESGVLSYSATLTPQGKLTDLAVELDALGQAEVAQCAERALAELKLEAGRRAARLSVVVGVERE